LSSAFAFAFALAFSFRGHLLSHSRVRTDTVATQALLFIFAFRSLLFAFCFLLFVVFWFLFFVFRSCFSLSSRPQWRALSLFRPESSALPPRPSSATMDPQCPQPRLSGSRTHSSITMLAGGWYMPIKRGTKIRSAGGVPATTAAAGAFGAAAIGAFAVGAFAIGALAIGRLAIRRILVGRARFKSLQIGELTVARLRVSELTVSDSLSLPPKTSLENRELE
jgi:hypothetical protein